MLPGGCDSPARTCDQWLPVLQQAARESFTQSVSGTDLVVGARTSPVQLMLYAVFRLGEPTNNMDWQSYQKLAQHPAVAWTIPLSLGDSHRGFAVLGTNQDYFAHFRYADKRPLTFAAGKPFNEVFETVVGAEVAAKLGYKLGQNITLTHGSGTLNLPEHADKPFRVVGILQRTGTPVDRTVHVNLAAIEAIHLDWQGGAPLPGHAGTGRQEPPDCLRRCRSRCRGAGDCQRHHPERGTDLFSRVTRVDRAIHL